MSLEHHNSMRVTIVLPHENIPLWLRNIILTLFEANGISLSVIVLSARHCPYKVRAKAFAAWQWFDNKIFARTSSLAQYTERLVNVRDDFKTSRDWIFLNEGTEDIADCKYARDADLVVWMAFHRPPPELTEQLEFGVWSLSNSINPAAGFWELVGRVPVTACELIRYGKGEGEDRILSCAYTATDKLLLSRSLVAVRAKDQVLLMSMLRRLVGRDDPVRSSMSTDGSVRPGRSIPNLPQLLLGVGKLYFRYAINVVKRPFYFDQWQLAYRIGGERLNQEGLTRLAPKHKGFWADPFVIRREGRTVIFFEELPDGESRGKILFLELLDDGSVGAPCVVLERDYHLSYPFLFEFEGSLFMVPESAEANRVEAFRCVRFPDQWESHAILLDGVRAFDPTLFEFENRWWMFATIQHNGNSSDDELHLFYASGPFEEWTPHPLNPISVDVRSARPAGALYWEDGQIFRPAQDCSARYGYALSIQKILRMNTQEYEEEEAHRIFPDSIPGAQGTHTINQSSGVTVYDFDARCRK